MSVLTLEGKGLKLNTRADIEPWLKDVDPTKIEEIHFGGNTLGVDASLALAEFLQKTTILKVLSVLSTIPPSISINNPRSPILQIYSPGASSPKFRKR